MRFLLLVCSWLVTISAVSIGQSPRGNSTGPEIPTLPYKLVEWPTPPTSAAGLPGAWNFIQAACGVDSCRLDPQGNIWVVDAPGHVVYKLGPDGKETMRLGTRNVSGTDTSHFNLPTDVAFGPSGDIYVTDGYGSARVVRYSPDGKYLLQWGTRGTGAGEFGLPHNLVIDRQGRGYVTDRANQRIEVC